MCVDVAPAASVERYHRQTPVSGNGSTGRDVGRYGAARPEPDVDSRALPLHGVHSASVVVEGCAKGVGGGGLDAASRSAGASIAI